MFSSHPVKLLYLNYFKIYTRIVNFLTPKPTLLKKNVFLFIKYFTYSSFFGYNITVKTLLLYNLRQTKISKFTLMPIDTTFKLKLIYKNVNKYSEFIFLLSALALTGAYSITVSTP